MNATIRCGGGGLKDFSRPWVMGIVNATPDSFYSGSRTPDSAGIRSRVEDMLAAGADCLDVGGYSSRQGCDDIPPEEEWRRLDMALGVIREVAGDSVPVSVDTFRAEVGARCVDRWGVGIINDISGGTADPEMWPMVAEKGVGYVLMHMRGTPQTMTGLTDYKDVVAEVVEDLAFKLAELRQLGVADVIIDPGFGFAKDTAQNFRLLRELRAFDVLECPVLAGVSRKTMIWRTLGVTPEESLAGTVALGMAALMNGADILRVHDVREAADTVRLFQAMRDA